MARATKVLGALAACACILIAGPATAANFTAPVVVTGGVTSVTATTAALAGTVNPGGQATTYYFEYGTGTAYGSTAPVPPGSAGAGVTDVNVSTPIASLAPNTTYHYRLVAMNASGGPIDGLDQMFTTKPAPPVVVTGGVNAATTTSATLTGTVNPEAQTTTYAFEYGTGTTYGNTAPAPPANAGAGTTDVSVSTPIASLAPGTTYHYRIDATNGSGTIHGADRTFKTKAAPSASAPIPATGGTKDVTATSATLAGTVNPKGQATVYDFQYGTSTAYGRTAPSTPGNAGAGVKNVKVSAGIAELAPGTTYHYRLVAASALGTTYGSDRLFRTKLSTTGPAVTITASPNPVVFGQATTVTGTIRAPHPAHASVALQVSGSATGRFTTVATTTVGMKGDYAFAKRALSSSTYFRTLAVGLSSAPLLVPVRFHVTMTVSTKHPARGHRVRFHGHVAPGRRHMRVQIQRLGSRGRWHTVARPRLHRRKGNAWAYSVSLVVSRGGRYRALVAPRAGYHRGFGPTVRIRVH